MKSQPPLIKPKNTSPRMKRKKRLVEAFSSLKNKEDVANFLRDLLTIAEIEEFANRLEMVRLLIKGYSYQKLQKRRGPQPPP